MQKQDLKVAPFNPAMAKMIEGSDKVRAQKCAQEIIQILQAYDCEMIPEVVISGANIVGNMRVVPKPRDLSGGNGGGS